MGRDDYGTILQLDRGDYGEKGDSDKIGLVARLAGDWNRKDGDDKFWTPDITSTLLMQKPSMEPGFHIRFWSCPGSNAFPSGPTEKSKPMHGKEGS